MLDLLLTAFTTLLVVIDPIGTAAIFAGMTREGSYAYKRTMALRATAIATVILILFTLLGDWLLTKLGISLEAFRVAGGILLFFVAIDMVFARESGLRSTTALENEEAEEREDISVFPLAIPLIAGPGAITTMLLLSGNADTTVMLLLILTILLVVLGLTLLLFLSATRVMKVIGVTGSKVIGRVLGVLLSALAVQFILDGLQTAFF